MSPIYVAFSRSNSFIAKAIMFFTGENISHSYLLYRSDDFDGWINLGAGEFGWVLEPLTPGVVTSTPDVYEIDADMAKGLQKNRIHLSNFYDYGALFGMIWVMMMRRIFKKRVPNPISYDKAWFCSEIVDQVLFDAGLDLGIDKNTVTPGDLRSLLEASGRAKKIEITQIVDPATLQEE